ncbi:MAG: hypothetical protein ACI9J3_002592 [Parvicellaceae bacterium]|jgi:hypothetical protein
MQPLLFKNTAEDYHLSNQNHLNIECGFGLFKAIIYEPTSGKVIWACAEESTGIAASITAHELEQIGYSEVSINLVNPYSTLIPNELFEEDQLDAYLSFNFETIDNAISAVDDLKTIEAKNCYLIFEKEKEAIHQLINNAKIGHQSTGLIELNRTKESIVLIEMHPTHFQLMHVAENDFKIFNCFAYENVEDLLYYITYALRQLNIEKEAEVEISGWLKPSDEFYKRLNAFLPNVKIVSGSTKSPDKGCIPASEAHVFNQVTRQHLCG